MSRLDKREKTTTRGGGDAVKSEATSQLFKCLQNLRRSHKIRFCQLRSVAVYISKGFTENGKIRLHFGGFFTQGWGSHFTKLLNTVGFTAEKTTFTAAAGFIRVCEFTFHSTLCTFGPMMLQKRRSVPKKRAVPLQGRLGISRPGFVVHFGEGRS